jgi:hypothetical protein
VPPFPPVLLLLPLPPPQAGIIRKASRPRHNTLIPKVFLRRELEEIQTEPNNANAGKKTRLVKNMGLCPGGLSFATAAASFPRFAAVKLADAIEHTNMSSSPELLYVLCTTPEVTGRSLEMVDPETYTLAELSSDTAVAMSPLLPPM